MASTAAAWRLEVARRLAERIKVFPGVQAILVAGSVARGYADAWSDLELALIWETPPPDETRLALAAALGGEFLFEYNGPSQEDQLLIDGLQVDLWQNTLADEEKVIARVLAGQSTNRSDSNFMDTLRACIPLHGEELIGRWKEMAQAYPEAMAVKVIQERLPDFYANGLALAIRRDNPNSFYTWLIRLQEAAFEVLLALNRAYFPAPKWLFMVLDSLAIKPTDAAARFRKVFSLPWKDAAAEMVRLLDETLDLVEEQLPQIDTALARKRLAYTRRG